MKTTEKLKKLIDIGYPDKDCLIREDDFNTVTKNLRQIVNEKEKGSYTLPLVDTIGKNIDAKIWFTIENI
jgi:hypothetical protein